MPAVELVDGTAGIGMAGGAEAAFGLLLPCLGTPNVCRIMAFRALVRFWAIILHTLGIQLGVIFGVVFNLRRAQHGVCMGCAGCIKRFAYGCFKTVFVWLLERYLGLGLLQEMLGPESLEVGHSCYWKFPGHHMIYPFFCFLCWHDQGLKDATGPTSRMQGLGKGLNARPCEKVSSSFRYGILSFVLPSFIRILKVLGFKEGHERCPGLDGPCCSRERNRI